MKSAAVYAAVVLCLVNASIGVCGENWPQFRGEHGSALAAGAEPPVHFNFTNNLLWKTEMPAGHASPVVWGNRIFLTGFADKNLETVCVDAETGKILWRQRAPAEKIERVHPVSSPASSTPATDGQRVYVYFGSYGLIAYDFEGKEAWTKPMPAADVLNGSGASPILSGGRLYLQCDQEGTKSYVMAVDAKSGETVWKTARPQYVSSYSTPVIRKYTGGEELVLAGSIRAAAYDLKTGRERWIAKGMEAISVCPSPALGEGMVFLMSQSMGSFKYPGYSDMLMEMDKDADGQIGAGEAKDFLKIGFVVIDQNKDKLVSRQEWDEAVAFLSSGENAVMGVRPGEGAEAEIVWKYKKGLSTISSPLYFKGRVYIVRDGGMVTCFEAATGKPLFEQERLDAAGEYYASPVASKDRIYFASNRGVISVVEPGDRLNVVARNELGEALTATPAIAGKRIYIRTAKQLCAFQ